eukprot:TRINITY_DN16942_c0_g1_i1.p3 TRINITY_DN16942_c0_g1~~TRINITY_DN16942_c0_g1_i1.p3  ORF type:complete len:164 (+),score=40.01 TRINITY_DN16942_c0_g1_i1:71-562(+)
MLGLNQLRGSGKVVESEVCIESESCVVELSQASQTSQVSQQVSRQGGEPVKLPQGMVSKWVELEQEWRTKGEVGNSDAEKEYVEAYENLVQNIGLHNLEAQTIPENAVLTPAQLEILKKQKEALKNAIENQISQNQVDEQDKTGSTDEEKQTENETKQNTEQT